MLIIGLNGLMGSGKTTVADLLIMRHGFVRVKFAAVLKDMLRVFGLTERHIEGDLKEVPCDLLCGQTPRHAMQTLGTEWGRHLIGSDVWVRAAMQRVCASGEQRIVMDDCRFPNEASAIHLNGGVVWRIVGRQAGDSSHPSESMQSCVLADFVLDNSRPLDLLPEEVSRLLRITETALDALAVSA